VQKSTPITKEIELTIDSLSYNGGRGVGRVDGIVVFVPLTAPGDVIRARVTSQKPRFWEAELVEILTPSPHRRKPPCKVADRCGGCAWQHVTYPAQVEQKIKILEASLRPLQKLAEWETLPFLAASEEFHYRNRIQVQIQNGKKGFFAKRSHDLVSIDTCLIAMEQLNVQLRELKPSVDVTRVELRADHGGDFAQVNDRQNAVLKERVTSIIEGAPDWIMDLYSGSGNLTRPILEKFPHAIVTAIELSAAAVKRGQEALPRVSWKAGDVGKLLAPMKVPEGSGVIVLDPPRTGCAADVLKQIERLNPRQIVYVSCNPTTFARDAALLVKSGAYLLRSVQGLDMFPQTEHVELVASLCSAT
jgi:23S rRNA (uracil1939-C5)-methyltransferase